MRKYILLILMTVAMSPLWGQQESGHLRVIFAGDIMGHSMLLDACKMGDGNYDFEPCFKYVKDYVESADIAIANLEVTLAGKPYTAYPYFSSPDELAIAAQKAGFDILTTANNHCLDKGRQGLERTIAALDNLGIPHLGTYVDKESHDKEHPLMVEKNGIRLALLCYTYGCNGFTATRPNVVNLIDTNKMRRDLERAREEKADYVVTLIHWGIEYQTASNREQQEIARWLMSHGSDIVIGGHPHVVQNLTADVNKDNDRYPEIVVYSMGNLLSNQRDLNTDGGIMIELTLDKKAGVTSVEDCQYMPYWVNRYTQKGKRYYRIVPATDAMEHPKAYGLSKESQRQLSVFKKLLDERIEACRPQETKQGEGFQWFGERQYYHR